MPGGEVTCWAHDSGRSVTLKVVDDLCRCTDEAGDRLGDEDGSLMICEALALS